MAGEADMTDDGKGVIPTHTLAQNIAVAIAKHGSTSAAIDAAEAIAVRILVEEHDGSDAWAASYIPRVRTLPHMGDCPHARAWMRGPVTCDACVYDELMTKAWKDIGN